MYTGGESGTQGLFSGLVQQETMPGGRQFLRSFLGQYGVKTTGKETQEELAEDVLRAERRMATTVDPQWWQIMTRMYPGVDNVTDIATMLRFKSGNVTEQQLNDDIARARATAQGGPATGKDLVTISQQFDNLMIKVNQGLDTFADKLAGSGLKIEDWVSKNFDVHPAGTKSDKMKGFNWGIHIDLDAAEKALMDKYKAISDWWNGKKADLPSKDATPESFGVDSDGNQFVIPGTNEKVAGVNDKVIKSTNSLDKFSRRLLATANIMVPGSGGATLGHPITIGPSGAPITGSGSEGFTGSRGAPWSIRSRGADVTADLAVQLIPVGQRLLNQVQEAHIVQYIILEIKTLVTRSIPLQARQKLVIRLVLML
jgi:hypothetical protein